MSVARDDISRCMSLLKDRVQISWFIQICNRHIRLNTIRLYTPLHTHRLVATEFPTRTPDPRPDRPIMKQRKNQPPAAVVSGDKQYSSLFTVSSKHSSGHLRLIL